MWIIPDYFDSLRQLISYKTNTDYITKSGQSMFQLYKTQVFNKYIFCLNFLANQSNYIKNVFTSILKHVSR